jgi:chitinase domain-containing protein 1
MIVRVLLLILFISISPAFSKFKRRSSSSHYIETEDKESSDINPSKTVFEKNLVETRISSAQIIKNHHLYHSEGKNVKGFKEGKVLGYVTPWNNHGYDVVKIFTDKFDYISPVWLQIKAIKSEGNIDFFVTGKHDIDQGWIREVKSLAKVNVPKFVPRIIFEGFTDEDWLEILKKGNLRNKIAEKLCEVINENQFDGLVLEYYGEAYYRIQRATKTHVVDFTIQEFSKELADKIHRHTSKEAILVISPWANMFNPDDLAILSQSFDYFSVMTYDYSSGGFGKIGANSPLPWIESVVDQYRKVPSFDMSKILLGLNFYGMISKSGGHPEAILGSTFIQKLKEDSFKANWDAQTKEHYFASSKTDSTIFFPTLKSIHERIQFARKNGIGLAIWETGQGLEYFYELF